MISKPVGDLFIISMLVITSVVMANTGQYERKIASGKCSGDTEEFNVHCGSVPSAVFNEGKLWVVFVQGNFVWLTGSSDLGKTFSIPVQVNDTPQSIYDNGENRPKIHVRDKKVFVSWTEKAEGQYTGNIRFARSMDGGATFSPSIKVNDDDLLTSHRFDAMHVTENGRIYLLWLDKRDKEKALVMGESYAGSALYFAVSDNGGESFGKNNKLADHSCECCRIALDGVKNSAPEGSEIIVFWRHIFAGGVRDHALMTIGPNGATDELLRATVDDWRINACPHHGPDIAASSVAPGYHLAWFSDGVKHQGLYYGFFDEKPPATAVPLDNRAGASHPRVIESGNRLYYAWKYFDGEVTSIRYRQSVNGGKNWSDEHIVATTQGHSDYPLLLQSGDAVVLSWHSTNEGLRIYNLDKENAIETKFPDKSVARGTSHLKAFTADSFQEIKTSYRNKTYVVALWSTTCVPCFAELEMLSKWRQRNTGTPVVLIATDNINESSEVTEKLERFKLLNLENWIFADAYEEKLRYSIDPNWRGELPRSYLVSPRSSVVIKGKLEENILNSWLATEHSGT